MEDFLRFSLIWCLFSGAASDTGDYPYYNNIDQYNDRVDPFKPNKPKNKTEDGDGTYQIYYLLVQIVLNNCDY